MKKIKTGFKILVLIILVASIIFIAKWKMTDQYELMTSGNKLSTNEKRPNHPNASNLVRSQKLPTKKTVLKDSKLKNVKFHLSRIFHVNQNEETAPHHDNIQSDSLNDSTGLAADQSNLMISKDSSPNLNKTLSILDSYEGKFDVVADQIVEMNQPRIYRSIPKIWLSRKLKNGSRRFEQKYGNFSSSCRSLTSPIPDLFCMNKLPYLEDVKNPCWYEGTSVEDLKLRCLPYFVLLGCAKCATTDLYFRLVEHPHIVKNNGYLNKESLYWSWHRYGISNFKKYPMRSFEGFTTDFNPLSDTLDELIHQKSSLVQKLIIGDATPPDFWDFRAWPLLPQNDGLQEPEVFTPQLIQHIYRNPKFILLFRNPTDRLYSDYFFLKQGNTPESFHEAVVFSLTILHECLSVHSERYCFFSSKLFSKLKCRIHYGCYSVFLNEWLRVFKRDQFYIARTEDYSEDMDSHIDDIYRFLDLEPVSISKMNKIESKKKSRVTASKKRSSPMLLKTRKIVDKFYEKYNRQLAKLLKNNTFLWSEANVFTQKKLRRDVV